MTLSIILNTVSIVLICLSCFISILVLLRIFSRIHPSISNISVLLTCNTYFTIILFCLTLLYAGLHSLYGHMHRLISLTAAFRLFRVVYYKTRIPQQFYVLIIAVAVLWLLSFLFILPHIVLHDFQYQSFDCGCPLLIIVIIYAYILRYVRRTMATQRERQRDAIVLRRIVIFLLFLVLFGVTTLSILVIYSITSYLIPFAPEIQTVHTSIGLVSTPTTRARR
ncbi:unnamed protein product, partial [Rotaria magnacalcarata]